MSGCDLCGDFPAELHARCHPTAPLRIEKISETEIVLYCYVPTCNREVARFTLSASQADRTITSLCDRLDRIHLIALDRSIHPSVRLEKIRELAEGFARMPA